MTRRLLLVAPHFPPSSAADAHRARTSAAHFPEFGWTPTVLSVAPESAGAIIEPRLLETLPEGLQVSRVGALPSRWTRRAGVGAIGFRAMPSLYRAGQSLLRHQHFDLVYFSTTAFPLMALGRVWKARFGTPFVLDMQDPWVNDYHSDSHPSKPAKHAVMDRLHRTLEPWTMARTDGLIAVSEEYVTTLQTRYPRLLDVPTATIPFGGEPGDFEVLRRGREANRFFDAKDGLLHGVYVGRSGADMQAALWIIFSAFRQGLAEAPHLFSRVRLHFVGTDYAPPDAARETVEPIARAAGVHHYVREHPPRVPYFVALQLLLDAQFLLVPGSDDPHYTASKIFPYILARRPLIAVFHSASSVCEILARSHAGTLVPFRPGVQTEATTLNMRLAWSELLVRVPCVSAFDEAAFRPYTAREMTRAQCDIFDSVVGRRQAHLGNAAPWRPTLKRGQGNSA